MSICPVCSENIDLTSLYFSAFPLYFKCTSCKVRLKLMDSTPFWLAFFLCLSASLALIIYLPFAREYGLGVVIAVFAWLVVYHKLLPYLLRKDNLVKNE